MTKRSLLALALIASLCTPVAYYLEANIFQIADNVKNQDYFSRNIENGTQFRVLEVIDGDTIEVDYFGVPKQVRLLGINTPEIESRLSHQECLGSEATNVTDYLLNQGAKVYLSRDEDNQDTDPYGRLLRYVDIPNSNNRAYRLNEVLVYMGLATAAPQYPLSEIDRYLRLQNFAFHNKKGLWEWCAN